MSSSQAIFEKAIHHHIKHALYSQLERIDDFQIGIVLLKRKKLLKKDQLDFTGLSVENLIMKEDLSGLPTLKMETKVIFTDTDDHSDKKIHIDADVDTEAKGLFMKLGAEVGGDVTKDTTVDVSLGSISHIKSNMYEVLNSKPLRADRNNAIVQHALEQEKTFYVINSIYQSEKVEIKINKSCAVDVKERVTLDTDAIGSDTGNNSTDSSNASASNDKVASVTKTAVVAAERAVQAALMEGASGKMEESVKIGYDTSSLEVSNRNMPSNIAFEIMKVDIKNGMLIPQASSGITEHVKIHFPYGDTFAQIVPDEDSTTSTVMPTLPDPEEAPRAPLSSISVASFKHENIPPIVNTKDMEASYLKSYLLKSGITKDTLEVLKQEHITSMDIFTSLSQGHWASLLPKLKIGQHALLMKLILSDTSEVGKLQDVTSAMHINSSKVMEIPESPMSMTPSKLFGGRGGVYFDDGYTGGRQITSVVLHKSDLDFWGTKSTVVRAIDVKYSDGARCFHGALPSAGDGNAGSLSIMLARGESVIGAIGRAGDLLYKIGFITKDQAGVTAIYGPFGGEGGESFIVYQDIVSLCGRAGNAVDAIGFKVVC